MPRGRGGKRDGVVGKAYQNRTDLNGANVVSAQPSNQPGAKLAKMAAPNQPYGAAKAQLDAQSQVAMGTPSTPPMQQTQPQGQQAQAPRAALTPLDAPGGTDENLFDGMDIGGGLTSSAMQSTRLDNTLQMQVLGLLDSLGTDVSPQVNMVRNYLRAGASNGIMQ